MNDADLSRYRTLLTDAIQACAKAGRPARAAWLVQYLRRYAPGFDLHGLGFASFRDLLDAVGGFTAAHDGYDVIAGLPGAAAPTNSLTIEQPPSRDQPARFEKVHPALWRAATRIPPTPSCYLDLAALRERAQVVVRSELPDAARASNVEIPVPSQHDQAEWVVSWTKTQGLPEDFRAEVQDAIGSGGIPRAIGVFKARGIDRRFLVDRVETTRKRLREWLEANGVAWAPPVVDLIRPVTRGLVAVAAPSDPLAPPTPPPPPVHADLREVVQEAVARLPHSELRNLWLPVGVVYDALCEKGRG